MPDSTTSTPTLESSNCSEMYLIEDALDVMEAALPSHAVVPQELQKINRWRSLADALWMTEIPRNVNNTNLLDEIHTIGREIYEAEAQWPKSVGAGELLSGRDDTIAKLGHCLAAYDAKAFMRSQERAEGIEDSPEKALGATLRYNTFCSRSEPRAPAAQESLALLKHELADITGGAIKRPGSRDVFDPALVEIKRNWASITQLTTEISYDGETIGDFGDNAVLHALGCYQPKMDEMQAIVAARRMFYEGHPFERDINPMVAMTHEEMYEQIVRDLKAAEGMTLSPEQRYRVNDLRKEFDATVTPPAGVKHDATTPVGPGM